VLGATREKVAPRRVKAEFLPPSGFRPGDARKRIGPILRALARAYPGAKTALDYRSPFELLVATILSAQSTDETVNRVTPALFQRYPDAAALSTASPGEVEALIHPTGFFRQKTKSIIGCAQALVARFHGEVPAGWRISSSFPASRARRQTWSSPTVAPAPSRTTASSSTRTCGAPANAWRSPGRTSLKTSSRS